MDVVEGLQCVYSSWADICVIDPPYNIGKDFGNSHDKMELEAYLKWADQWIAECTRILKPTGTMYIYGFSEILAHLFVRIDLPKRWLVWHYTNKNNPHATFWGRSHESIICCWKTEERIFNLDDVREAYTDTFLKNAAGKTRKGTAGRFSHSGKDTEYKAHEKGAMPRDVLKVPALAGGAGASERFVYCKTCRNLFTKKHASECSDHETVEHPTQKPYELTEKLLLASRPQVGGNLVVPFSGTGSELLVARNLGLNAIGFDLNPDYVEMATLLLAKGHPQSAVDPTVPVTPLGVA